MRHGCHGDCVPLAPEHTIRIFICQRAYSDLHTKQNWFLSPFPTCVARPMVRPNRLFLLRSAVVSALAKQKRKIDEQWPSFNVNRFGNVMHSIWIHFSRFHCTFCRFAIRIRFFTQHSFTETLIETRRTEYYYFERGKKRTPSSHFHLRPRVLSLRQRFWLLRRGLWFNAQPARHARTQNETERLFAWREQRQMLLLQNDTINDDWRMGDAGSAYGQRPIQYVPHTLWPQQNKIKYPHIFRNLLIQTTHSICCT